MTLDDDVLGAGAGAEGAGPDATSAEVGVDAGRGGNGAGRGGAGGGDRSPGPDGGGDGTDGGGEAGEDDADAARGAAVGTAGPPPGSGDRRERWVVWLGTALAVAPLVVMAVAVLAGVGETFRPHGDLALTELRTRDVGVHPVLVGPFSRDGWYHPGPALFYLLAVPYRLLGGSSAGLLVGALAINGASVAGMAALARRRGGTPLALCTLVLAAVLLRALGPSFLVDPWNPYITVLPYGAMVFLTWSALCGDRWALPLATVVSAFLIQTHSGYIVLALPLLLVAAVAHAVAPVRRGPEGPPPAAGRRRPWRRAGPVAVALAVGALMWAPPVVEQVTSSPGNLRSIAGYFRSVGDEGHPVSHGWAVVSAQYAAWPEWMHGPRGTTIVSEPVYLSNPPLAVLLVLVVAAAVALWRRQGAEGRWLVATWALASVLGVVAVMRTAGFLYAYRLGWAWVLGMVGGLMVLWAAWTGLAARVRRAERVLVPTALVVLAVVGVTGGVAGGRAAAPNDELSRRIGVLTTEVVDELPGGEGAVVIRSAGFVPAGYEHGLMAQLERRGIDTRVEAGHSLGAGTGSDHNEIGDDPVRADLTVASDRDVLLLRTDPALVLVAYSGIPFDELRRRAAEVNGLEDRHVAGGIGDLVFARESERLLPGGSAIAVFRRQP